MPLEKDNAMYTVAIAGLSWLSQHTFEIRFERPGPLTFIPGQKTTLTHEGLSRDYTLIGSASDDKLALCIRKVRQGKLSSRLAGLTQGQPLQITPAFGYFLYQPSDRTPVFVATGTGIAPFAAFALSGAQGYHLLHGVQSEAELYYRELLSGGALNYVPCLSREVEKESVGGRAVFAGRVTTFLEERLAPGRYDFYLCGRADMLRDATRIIDRRFPEARVFSELYY